MNGFKKPSGGFPAARRTPLSRAKMAAAVGDAAEVPATPSAPPATQWGPSARVCCQPEIVSRGSSVPLTVHNHAVRVLLSTERRDVGVPAPAAHLETDQRMAHCGGAAMLRQPKEAAGPFGGLPTPCVVPQCGRWQRRLLLVRAHLHRRSARTHGDGSGSSN